MAFLFHYIETSLFASAYIFAFIGTFLFIVLAGLISVKSKLSFIIPINTLSILLSIVLGGKFITSPNGSWFNPFGMNFAIVFTGIIILIGILIIRSFVSAILKNR
jgi:hypothetical protein